MCIIFTICQNTKSALLQFKYSITFKTPAWYSKLQVRKNTESYISFIAENGRYRFNLFITPSVRDILLAILAECERQLRNSLIVNPRKLNSFTFSMIVLFIMSCGIILC